MLLTGTECKISYWRKKMERKEEENCKKINQK
jgi:hypothetical protein